MDPDYSRHYRALYERHWWWRARRQIVLSELERLRPGGSWVSILDVGCGDGLFFPDLERLGEVEGVEPEEALVTEKGRALGTIHVTRFDERFRPGKRYDLVLMLDVLEHLRDPGGALRHAIKLLEPGGSILLTVPAFPVLWTSHDDLNHHQMRYTRKSLMALADRAALSIDRVRYLFHWLFPVKLVIRLREKAMTPAPSMPRIPRPLVNDFLSQLCLAEYRSTGSRGLPWGTSLLAIGRAANADSDKSVI
ncbi:MAG: class I SAM-dependent methyltransferase [Gammaproteobacteria bacterium]